MTIKTTIVGSLPKPSWLAKPQVLWAPWQLQDEQLAEGKRDAVRTVLKMQEAAGIDLVCVIHLQHHFIRVPVGENIHPTSENQCH